MGENNLSCEIGKISDNCRNNPTNTDNCEILRKIAEDCGRLRKIAEEIKKIATFYGEKNQIIKTSEELAELNQILMKYLAGRNELLNVRHDIISEMADVMIMQQQLSFFLHIDTDELLAAMERKLQRQIVRISYEQDRATA